MSSLRQLTFAIVIAVIASPLSGVTHDKAIANLGKRVTKLESEKRPRAS